MFKRNEKPLRATKFGAISEERGDFEQESDFEEGEPDWEFFLPDEEALPELGDPDGQVAAHGDVLTGSRRQWTRGRRLGESAVSAHCARSPGVATLGPL